MQQKREIQNNQKLIENKLDKETIKHQDDLMYKFENDQSNNMNTKVKNPLEKLSLTISPNLAISSQQLDKKYHDYVKNQGKA